MNLPTCIAHIRRQTMPATTSACTCDPPTTAPTLIANAPRYILAVSAARPIGEMCAGGATNIYIYAGHANMCQCSAHRSVRNLRRRTRPNRHFNLAALARARAQAWWPLIIMICVRVCWSLGFPNFVFTCNRTINMLSWRCAAQCCCGRPGEHHYGPL